MRSDTEITTGCTLGFGIVSFLLLLVMVLGLQSLA